MHLLDPIVGAKIRAAIVTISSLWIVLQQTIPVLAGYSWATIVTQVLAGSLAVLEVLTHATPLGNVDPPPAIDPAP